MADDAEISLKYRRRFPRRQFKNPVGVLACGRYEVEPGCEIGEGGMLFDTKIKFKEGTLVVVNFFVPKRDFVTVRGEILYTLPSRSQGATSYGVKFNNLSFESKRMIRDYIAEKKATEA